MSVLVYSIPSLGAKKRELLAQRCMIEFRCTEVVLEADWPSINQWVKMKDKTVLLLVKPRLRGLLHLPDDDRVHRYDRLPVKILKGL